MKVLQHLSLFERGVTYFLWANAVFQVVAYACDVPVPWHVTVGSLVLVAFDALVNTSAKKDRS